MTAKITISSEPGSAKFSDRVLLLDQNRVRVSRSSTEDKPETDNAVFDCRVLSKSQAVFSLVDEKLYLRDNGSSNGTFINNFRLSQAGKKSEETEIYSQDIIRFGFQFETDKTDGGIAKCIISRIQIYFADGTEFPERAVSDKFFRCKEDVCGQEKSNHHQEDIIDQLVNIETLEHGKENEILKETIANLEKKLKTKQNENINLLEKIANISNDKLQRVSEMYHLKEAIECQNLKSIKLEDELAVKLKEHIGNLNAKDLQNELEETRKALKSTTEEICLLREKSKVEGETMKIKDKEISKLSIYLADLEDYKMKVSEEESDTHIQMKKEITELTNLVQEDKELKEVKYVNLKSNKENETVHVIQIEMKRVLNQIAEDKETILKKDQTIIELVNNIKDKHDENESKIDKYCKENDNLKVKIDTICRENERKIDNLQIETDHLKNTIIEKEEEIKQMKAIFTTNESVEAKIKESMCIIEQKNKEIEIMQNRLKNQTYNGLKIKEFNYDNILIISELKASICQKKSKIKSLKESIDKRDTIIVENNAKFENDFEVGIQHVQADLADQKKEFDGIIKEREEMMHKLRERIESDKSKINHVKSEFDNLMNENEEYLKSKDEEIKNLKHEIIKEKQIVAHVQFRQKREIVKKDREMSILNTILTQERRILLDKEEEVEKFRSFSFEENLVVLESPPTRPPRTKSLVITTAMQEHAGIPTHEQADIPINKQAYNPTYEQVKHPTNEEADIPTQSDQDNHNSDAVIFHDALNNELSIALSDEEDVLMEDLELDEETDDRKPRRSDINIEDFP